MSKEEWEQVYRDAWTQLLHRRACRDRSCGARVASGINTQEDHRRAHVFSGATRIEGVHPLQFGFVRRKVRTQRRHGMPIENPLDLLSAPRCRARRVAAWRWYRLYRRYRAISAARHSRDPASASYVDEALTPPVAGEAMPHFVQVFADRIPKTHGAPPRELAVARLNSGRSLRADLRFLCRPGAAPELARCRIQMSNVISAASAAISYSPEEEQHDRRGGARDERRERRIAGRRRSPEPDERGDRSSSASEGRGARRGTWRRPCRP